MSPAICEHVVHPDGIHEMIVHDSTRLGAEAYFAEIGLLYQFRTDASPPLRVLLNVVAVTLPISYMIQRGIEINRQYPHVGQLRTAIMNRSAAEARVADSLVWAVRFRSNRIRFFDVARRDQAVAWLLKDN